MADGWWIRHRDSTNSQVSQNGCRNEDIEALNKQMSYKQKQKRALGSELAALCQKKRKCQWYQQKKQICRNETRHGHKTNSQRLECSDLDISDESNFFLSSPPSFTGSYSCASQSTSPEIVSDDSLQATVVVIESQSGLKPFWTEKDTVLRRKRGAEKAAATCHRKWVQANAQLQAGQVPMRTQPNMHEQANIHTKRDNCDHLLHVNTDPELEQFFFVKVVSDYFCVNL